MTVLNNNFEGGPDGSAITAANSNQSGLQNPFDVVYSGTLGMYYANASALGRPTAEYVCKLDHGSPGDYQYCEWTTSMGGTSQAYTRFYFYVTSTATVAGSNDLNLFTLSNAANADFASIYLRNTSQPVVMQIYDAQTLTFVNGTTIIQPNAWYRVEFRANSGSGTGSSDLYLYAGDDVDSDAVTEHISQTGQDYGATSFGEYTLGNFHSFQTNAPVTYFSNWQVNNTGYPGPAPWRYKGSPGSLTNAVAPHDAIC